MQRRHERHALGLLALARRLALDAVSVHDVQSQLEDELLEIGYFDAATHRARVLSRRLGR
jgi:hypothetical protein